MIADGRAAAAQPVPAAAAPAQERAGPPAAPPKPEPLRLDSLFAGVWLPADEEEDAEDGAGDGVSQLRAAASMDGAGAPTPSLQGPAHAAAGSLSNGARESNGAPPKRLRTPEALAVAHAWSATSYKDSGDTACTVARQWTRRPARPSLQHPCPHACWLAASSEALHPHALLLSRNVSETCPSRCLL
jgi:hypothetical protein